MKILAITLSIISLLLNIAAYIMLTKREKQLNKRIEELKNHEKI